MVKKHIAFNSTEHEKITKKIMGKHFDQKIFRDVQSWIDGKGGKNHRISHGHDKDSESYVKNRWGNIGLEMFQIHILSDRIHERLPDIVKVELEDVKSGKRVLPYFNDSPNQTEPYCRRNLSSGTGLNISKELEDFEPDPDLVKPSEKPLWVPKNKEGEKNTVEL